MFKLEITMKNAYIIVIGREREMEMGFWNFDKVWNAKLLFFEGMIKLKGVVSYLGCVWIPLILLKI